MSDPANARARRSARPSAWRPSGAGSRRAPRLRRCLAAARPPRCQTAMTGAGPPVARWRRGARPGDAVLTLTLSLLRAAGRPMQRPATMPPAPRRKQAPPRRQPARLRAADAHPPMPTPTPLRHTPSALQALRRRAPPMRKRSPPPPLGARRGRMRCWSASLLHERHSTPMPAPAAQAATRSRSAQARHAPAGCPAPSRALRGPGARGGGPTLERPPRPRTSSVRARARRSRGRRRRRPSGTRAGAPLAAAACAWTLQPCPPPGGRPGRRRRGAPGRPRPAYGALWAPRRRDRPSRAAARTAVRVAMLADP